MNEQFELQLDSPPPISLPALWTPDDIYQCLLSEGANAFGKFPDEDDRIEWKSARYAVRELGDYFSMWANTQPSGGLIIVGRENDKALLGCSGLASDRIGDIQDCGPSQCPDARYDLRKIAIKTPSGTNDFVLVFRVFYRPDRLVETVRRDAFVRSGWKKRKLTEEEKREVRIAKGEIAYEKEPCNLAYPTDFDELLIDKFCNSYRSIRRLRSSKTREQILQLNHLGISTGGRFVPNLACAILFAHDPREVVPGAKIRVLRYEGDVEKSGKDYNVVRDETIDGPLPRMLEEADEIIAGQIRHFTRLRDGRFESSPEYPRDVWFEAVVNACVHRSYNFKNMNIFVKLFDDHLVVESPGSFPPPTTAENIYGSHNPRNPYLMHVLFYLDFVKEAHEGTTRMRDDMIRADLPAPLFAQKELGHHQVHVTLHNDIHKRKEFVDTKALKLIGRSAYDELSSDEKQIVNYLAERGKANVTDIARVQHRDWTTAKRLLTKLVEKGVVQRRARSSRERDSSAHYVLKRRNEPDTDVFA